MKVTIIGGGSYSWAINLISDFLLEDFFDGAELCLMDINQQRLEHIRSLALKLGNFTTTRIKITTTTNLTESLHGCDYVIVSVAIGGCSADILDHEIARRYGFWNIKGHDIGPAGFSRVLRHVPFLAHVSKQMQKI
jgi:alpha-galactosidase/6-phospho-beta-glucosidase family protein